MVSLSKHILKALDSMSYLLQQLKTSHNQIS